MSAPAQQAQDQNVGQDQGQQQQVDQDHEVGQDQDQQQQVGQDQQQDQQQQQQIDQENQVVANNNHNTISASSDNVETESDAIVMRTNSTRRSAEMVNSITMITMTTGRTRASSADSQTPNTPPVEDHEWPEPEVNIAQPPSYGDDNDNGNGNGSPIVQAEPEWRPITRNRKCVDFVRMREILLDPDYTPEQREAGIDQLRYTANPIMGEPVRSAQTDGTGSRSE